jgi:hypothetical protein
VTGEDEAAGRAGQPSINLHLTEPKRASWTEVPNRFSDPTPPMLAREAETSLSRTCAAPGDGLTAVPG